MSLLLHFYLICAGGNVLYDLLQYELGILFCINMVIFGGIVRCIGIIYNLTVGISSADCPAIITIFKISIHQKPCVLPCLILFFCVNCQTFYRDGSEQQHCRQQNADSSPELFFLHNAPSLSAFRPMFCTDRNHYIPLSILPVVRNSFAQPFAQLCLDYIMCILYFKLTKIIIL